MDAYSELILECGYPNSLIECREGKIGIPNCAYSSPPPWRVHPPALIPIWFNGSLSSYVGLWKHWFGSRNPTFVRMDIEDGRVVSEIARTLDQLYAYMVIDSIVAEDRLSNEAKDFARRVSLNNVVELETVTLLTGDNVREFYKISNFQSKTPLECVKQMKDYDGDFPNIKAVSDFDASQWSSFEISLSIFQEEPEASAMPDWFYPNVLMEEIFEKYLAKGDLMRAWFTLNSSGWRISDALVALNRLVEATNDRGLLLLQKAWSQCALMGPESTY